ncbi:MAG: hypothetical protein K6A68_03210 [Clostridiales bacterium]|nr:hypothetical protein [Clostridia bacterium]MCR4882550.1 hypothetical protein [Clostridiales bacterium]
MKKWIFPVLVLLLVCLCVSALAEVWYVKTPNGKTVNMRDTSRKVVGHIPYGTALVPDSGKCTELVAYVTYNGVSGYVSWNYLVQDEPAPYKKSSSSKKEAAVVEVYGEGQYSVSVTGGVLQFQNKKGKASGTKYSEVKFDDPVSLVVTATVPKKQKIDYWLINGVKLQLKSKTLALVGEDEDITIEIVYK